MPFAYPPARRADVVDDYHGVSVSDPYRWLEDPDGDETREFVRAQNAVTMPYLQRLPDRHRLRSRMEQLWDVPRTGAPQHRSGVLVWAHNDGLSDQPLIFVQTPQDYEPRVLIDPNLLSDDGAAAVIVMSLSPDGRHLAYTVAEAGSDWQVARIRDTSTGRDVAEELHYVKFTSFAWHGDGFFYSRFPEVDTSSTATVRDMSVHYHSLGTDQATDELVFSNPTDPDPGYAPTVTHDGRYLVLSEWRGTSTKNGLLYRALDDRAAEWIRLVPDGVALHSFLGHVDGSFLVHTDLDAPNGRVVRIAPKADGERHTVVDETADPIETAAATDGRLVIVRMREAAHVVDLYELDGTPAGRVELPGTGSVAELSCRIDDPAMYLGFQSFVRPPLVLRATRESVNTFAGAEPPLDPDAIEVVRRRAASSDGSDVGMFVIRMKDTPLPAPTELYGYGGFNISLTPAFSPARLAFLEEGGVVAVANLRGGNEHGETWHEQGMLGRKQQVFDDFVACAEHLIGAGISSPSSLAIRGGSNGGLLTSAVMLQRPELFGAVVSHVPVTDMLRFQHFTAGRYWTPEYGDSADPDAFRWLIAYSPYHNADPAGLPPLLITTAETDDRVVPMHALKLAAALQHAAGGRSEQPLLVRVETRAGHGLGKPTSKLIDESADVYAFILHHCRP